MVSRCPLVLIVTFAVAAVTAGPAAAVTPLATGTPPTLDWGEHRIDLQVGWPAEAASVGWGTRSGWNLGAFAGFDLGPAPPHWTLGMSFCRPFAHLERTSGFVHLALGSLLADRRGEAPRFGGEGQAGLGIGVGLGRLRHVTWDLGFQLGLRVGPGLDALVPTLRVEGFLGWSFWLSPEVAIALRGRGGLAGMAGMAGAPGPIWNAAAVVTRLF